MSNLTPWTRADMLEFPEEARTLDLDMLLDRTEAEVAPGQHYRVDFRNRPLPGPPEVTSTSLAEVPALAQLSASTSLTPWPAVSRLTRLTRMTDVQARANSQVATQTQTRAAPPSQWRERSPAPRSAKKQRANPTKADWETMDYQDTESEQ